jgi:hypothetical protein
VVISLWLGSDKNHALKFSSCRLMSLKELQGALSDEHVRERQRLQLCSQWVVIQ